ncbi:MAG: cytochrome c [Thermodesulfovibrionales bacterium]
MDTHIILKNSFLVIFLGVASFLCVSGGKAQAAAKAAFLVCSNCHTMHSSQDGTIQRGGGAGSQGLGSGVCLDCHSQYRAVLLKLDCIGCHANITSNQNVDPVTQAPLVAHNSASDLAGGNFRYIFDGSYNKGHNVHGFGVNVPPADLTNFPPGYSAAYDPSSLKYDQFSVSFQIMCAGRNGCHGNRDVEGQIDAIKGAHHEDDAVLKFGSIDESQQGLAPANVTNGQKVGKSYRFLMGVKGGEEASWEGQNPTATKHNEYKGSSGAHADSQNWGTIDTMSEFCAECHGDFHSSTGIGGASNPWVRHPTDTVLPNTADFGGYTQYSLTAPLARQAIPQSAGSGVTLNSDIVMCLSCHRGHASNYYKALRWDYKNATLSTAISGCAVCHTTMN